jgi:hypothetical protein
MPRAVQSLNLRIPKLRLFNNSVFECLEGLTYLDPRRSLSRSLSERSEDPDSSGMRDQDDGRLLTVVIPAKAGI